MIILFLALILFFLVKNSLDEQFKQINWKKPKLVKKVSLKGKKLTPVVKKVTSDKQKLAYKKPSKTNKKITPPSTKKTKVAEPEKVAEDVEVKEPEVETETSE